ncbi:hypothetical protein DENSPDRAFT_882506 [Dentipellis sp. KUC8613]|nr:hypothetical protein DENSPDRAFT_882506 [Dentipellis sp. KUC8613]
MPPYTAVSRRHTSAALSCASTALSRASTALSRASTALSRASLALCHACNPRVGRRCTPRTLATAHHARSAPSPASPTLCHASPALFHPNNRLVGRPSTLSRPPPSCRALLRPLCTPPPHLTPRGGAVAHVTLCGAVFAPRPARRVGACVPCCCATRLSDDAGYALQVLLQALSPARVPSHRLTGPTTTSSPIRCVGARASCRCTARLSNGASCAPAHYPTRPLTSRPAVWQPTDHVAAWCTVSCHTRPSNDTGDARSRCPTRRRIGACALRRCCVCLSNGVGYALHALPPPCRLSDHPICPLISPAWLYPLPSPLSFTFAAMLHLGMNLVKSGDSAKVI